MVTEKQAKTIANSVAKEVGIESDLIDTQKIDLSLGYLEAKEELLNQYAQLSTKANITKDALLKNELQKAQSDKRYIKHLESEQRKEIEEIKNTTTTHINKHFAPIQELIKTMISSKEIHSLLLLGEPGLGKSFQAIYTLTQQNKRLNEDYIIISSYITPLQLYEMMYEHRDKIIIFDDVFKLMDNPICKGILMSALWSVTPTRIIQYYTSSDKRTAPDKFEFSGKVVFITNELPSNIVALKSRCLWYEIRLSFKERIKICYEMCKKRGIPQMIMEWIEQMFDESYDLNLRTPIKVHQIHQSNPSNWEKIAATQFEADPEIKIMNTLLKSGKPVKDQIREFQAETGRSRRHYFYLKKRLMRKCK